MTSWVTSEWFTRRKHHTNVKFVGKYYGSGHACKRIWLKRMGREKASNAEFAPKHSVVRIIWKFTPVENTENNLQVWSTRIKLLLHSFFFSKQPKFSPSLKGLCWRHRLYFTGTDVILCHPNYLCTEYWFFRVKISEQLVASLCRFDVSQWRLTPCQVGVTKLEVWQVKNSVCSLFVALNTWVQNQFALPAKLVQNWPRAPKLQLWAAAFQHLVHSFLKVKAVLFKPIKSLMAKLRHF